MSSSEKAQHLVDQLLNLESAPPVERQRFSGMNISGFFSKHKKGLAIGGIIVIVAGAGIGIAMAVAKKKQQSAETATAMKPKPIPKY